MATYSVTFTDGSAAKTIYFDDDDDLTGLLSSVKQHGALMVGPGSMEDGSAYAGNRAIMADKIISIQTDPLF